MAKKQTKKTGDEAIIEEAKKRFKVAQEAWAENRKRYVEDVRFASGEHWPEAIKRAREKQNRPCLVIDKLNQYVRQVVNDSRQNRPAIKVRPVDSKADPDVANVYQGLIRHIEDRSNADTAYDTAIDTTTKGGFGFFRVLSEYAHEGSFDQELCIKRIRNPLTVWFDPHIQEPDGSDAGWCFVEDRLTKEEFEDQFPKSEAKDWDFDSQKYGDWLDEEGVRICEYWKIVEEEALFHLLEDGTSIRDEDYQQALSEGVQPPPIVQSRPIPVKRVKWYKLTGCEVLDKRDWPGIWLPVVPVFGNESDIEGKVVYSGLVRAARDPQMLYNFSRSAFAERVALTPKAPWVAADGQVEDYEADWANSNQENIAVLKYRPVDVAGHPVPPPQRQPSADIPAGFVQDMQLSEHDIQSALGMYNASLGAESNEKSGKAIMARQREGDMATFHYQDNLARAIRHLGRILVDLIPKIYDTQRVVRILGEDGTPKSAEINPELGMAKQDIGAKAIYNLGVGTYDVTVSVGPSYTTKRQEAAEAMVQMTQANPALFPMIGDLMVRNMDWPGANEMADRLKAMLPPEIQKLEQQESDIPPEVQSMMQGLQQQMEAMQQGAQAAIMERDQALQQAGEQLQQMQQELAALKVQAKGKDDENDIKQRESEIKAFEAETERMKVEKEYGIEKIESLLAEHEARVKEIMAACQAPQVQGEEQEQAQEPADSSPEIMAMIQESHNQTMQAIAAIAEAMTRPKTMQIQTPSGQVYSGQVQ